MSAIQETERLSFGSARLYGTDANGNALLYGELNDINIDIKTELKEAWGEGNYSFAVADSHRSIDISAKHYLLDQNSLADSIGGSAPAANLVGYIVDEAGVVGTTTYTYTLANANPITLLSVVEGVTVNGVIVPVYLVQATTAVAGISYSLSTDVLTFAAGDSGNPLKITYSYTADSALGGSISVVEGFQNSQPFMTLTCVRRDASRLDGSTGIQVWEFARVRDAGIKVPYKEGDFSVYERSFKAFASPWGQVLTVRSFNE